jgi:predicted regulator of Ras-like GTPase activity (Roadblock/LC7/MglB family)
VQQLNRELDNEDDEAESLTLSPDAENFNWLITGFVDRTPGVAHAAVVSSDGLLIALSQHIPRDAGDQLAAISSALSSIVRGAADLFEGDYVRQTVVEMGKGYYIVMTISDGSILASLAGREADIGMVGYEMARLSKQAGELLTPALRSELQSVLPR